MRKLLVLLFAFATLLAEAAPANIHLETMTWIEVRDAIASGKTTALVPIGGTEQNGPHIALGKHNARARELAARIAERLGSAIVAPVLSYVPEGPIDPPGGHMRYAGTISIPNDAFEKVLEGTARSLLRHGFRHVVFLADHGGYRASLDRVAVKIRGVHSLPEYYREMEHGGRDDTSLTLALVPELVRADRVAVARKGVEGVQGDAAGATASRGNELADEIVQRSVAAIGKATAGR